MARNSSRFLRIKQIKESTVLASYRLVPKRAILTKYHWWHRGLQGLTDREVACYTISCKNSTNIDIVIDWLVKHSKSKSWYHPCHYFQSWNYCRLARWCSVPSWRTPPLSWPLDPVAHVSNEQKFLLGDTYEVIVYETAYSLEGHAVVVESIYASHL